MRPRLREVVERLTGEGTLSSDDAAALQRSLAAAAAKDTSAPWYVRLLSAFGAWVAALLIMWFLVAIDVLDSGGPALAVGLVLLSAACAARGQVRNDFLVQAALALAVAGEVLVLFGVTELWRPREVTFAAIALALNAAVVVALPDPVGRFLASAFAIVCAVFLSYEGRGPWVEVMALLLAALALAVWASPAGLGSRLWRAIRQPVGVALVAGFLSTIAFELAEPAWRDRAPAGGLTTIGLTVLALVLVARILSEQRVPLRSEAAAAAAAGVVLLGAVGWRTPGILGAAMVLALGYHRREVVLVGLAAAFFAGFTVWFYYSLQMTLLEKSGVLVLSGALALAARRYVQRRMPASPPPVAPVEGAKT